MPKKDVLFLDACVRADASRTLDLANRFLSKLADAQITHLKLDALGLQPLDNARLHERDHLLHAGETDAPFFVHANTFRNAQWIVIAAPYWDFSFPALLKLYVENVSCSGVTFAYDETGRPVSLCRAERLVYITTAGGYIGENDYGFTYIRAVMEQFFGVKQSYRIAAEGLDIIGNDPQTILTDTESQFSEVLC